MCATTRRDRLQRLCGPRCRRCRRGGRPSRLASTRAPRARRPRASRRRRRAAQPSISRATCSTCVAGARRDGDPHARRRELARDVRADPAPAAGDERDPFARHRSKAHCRSAGSISSSDSGILQRRQVAGILAERASRARRGGRSSRSASSAARSTKRIAVRPERLAEHVGDGVATPPSRVCSAPGFGTQKIHATSPFTSCGTPTAAASATMPDADRRRLELRRADALARDVERVVGAAVQEPVAVLVDRRPVAVRPDVRGSGASTSRGSARRRPRCRGSCRATAAGRRARPPAAADGERPRLSTTSMSIAERAGSRARPA